MSASRRRAFPLLHSDVLHRTEVVRRSARAKMKSSIREKTGTESLELADDKLYKAEYVGSGTFIISKPKRKKTKQRQSNLKNPMRGSRK